MLLFALTRGQNTNHDDYCCDDDIGGEHFQISVLIEKLRAQIAPITEIALTNRVTVLATET